MGNVPGFCRNISLTTNETSYAYLSECWNERRIAEFLRIYLPLIILPISLISNCLSFLALRSHHMRGTSTAFFMLVLSVLDPFVLLTKNLVYYPTFIPAYSISCKILYFLIYVLGYTNVWILVIMTADKFFAVWFPLKVSNFCTITRAKYICLCLLIMTSIISFHHFWTIDCLIHPQNNKQRYCYYDMERYSSIQHIWRYLDFIIWCFLPFILILALSILIIYKLRQKENNSNSTIQQIINYNTNSRKVENENKQKQNIKIRTNQKTESIRSQHRHITLMLLAVAMVFLCLTLPNSIYFVLEITYNFNTPPKTNDYYQWLRYHRLRILTVIMFQLSDLQHATNFFLYLLTSYKFRRAVVKICITKICILTCLCQKKIKSKEYSNKKFYNHQNNISFRLSRSRMSNIIQNSRRKINKQQQKSFYTYHSFLPKSKSITTTTTELV